MEGHPMKTLFTLPQPFSTTARMDQLHVWDWAKNRADPESATIINYLTDNGFKIGENKISEDDYNALRNIINHFHWLRVRDLQLPKE